MPTRAEPGGQAQRGSWGQHFTLCRLWPVVVRKQHFKEDLV